MSDDEMKMSEESPGSHPPAGGEEKVAASREAPEAAAGAESAVQAGFPPGGSMAGSTTAKGGRFKGWISGHRMLAGIIAGLLIALLLGGVFAIGYVVAKPEGREAEGPDGRTPLRQRLEERKLRSVPSPTPRDEEMALPWLPGGYMDEVMDEISAKLGISTDDLLDEMRGGKSIAEIAKEKGVSSDDLVEAAAAKIREVADRLSSEGEIGSKRAERIKSNAEDLAKRLIERERGRLRGGLPLE